MGNMQYPTKGLLERDSFEVPKVSTGEHCSVTSELVCVNISDNSVSTFLTILCQHFGRFCVNIFDDSIFAGKKVEGTECYERAILPEKALREKLETTIENDFSKTTLILF